MIPYLGNDHVKICKNVYYKSDLSIIKMKIEKYHTVRAVLKSMWKVVDIGTQSIHFNTHIPLSRIVTGVSLKYGEGGGQLVLWDETPALG